jgi:hypothetical protein
MKDLYDNKKVKNHRQIKVKFLPPTNFSGARVKIYEPKRWNEDTVKAKIFNYSYEIGDVLKQGYNTLTANGFNIKGYASEIDNYIFFCDNWSDDFKCVKDLKNID